MEHQQPEHEDLTQPAASEEPEVDKDLTEEAQDLGSDHAAETPADGPEKLLSEMAELKDKYLRLYAEFDNFRRRTARERIEMSQTAGKEVIKALLPVVDDFSRAMKADDNLPEGIKLVHGKFTSVLQQQGLRAMESNGETFDVELHEAVTEFPAPSPELKGKVIDTVETGYYLNDSIIRYAKVVVGK